MGRRTEESLIDALSYCSLRDLPEPDDKENIWIRALARVAKADGNEYYVYVEKDANAENRIKKDFGSMSAIVRVLEYYPFSYLRAEFMPTFKTQKKDERIAYLTRFDKNLDYSSYSLKDLNLEILKGAIAMQMAHEKRSEKANKNEE
jgi:hypothetical protein